MVRYLSPEWLAAAQALAGADPSVRQATAGVHLVVQHVVTEGETETAFHAVVDDGELRFVAGAHASPTVTFTEDRRTAVAVAKGELSAAGAFMTGRIRVRGDLSRLIEHHDAFSAVDDTFDRLRAETEY